MNDRKGHYLFLIAISVVVLFTQLGAPKLWDRDEPRNAGCAAEMLQRQDWVVPTFNAELRTHKPILLYWLMMVSYGLFGVNEFAARLPSALLSVGTVLATYEIGRRLFRPAVGVWAGWILVTTLMFDVAARAATPDALLIFLGTMALMTFTWGAFPEKSKSGLGTEAGRYFSRRWQTVILMYAWMGLAVLAKGPVGLVMPTAVIGMFLLVMRLPTRDNAPTGVFNRTIQFVRPFAPIHFLRTCWFMRPVLAVAVAMAVALPWYLLVGIRTDGAWVRGFLLEHNVSRAISTMEGHRGSALFYYPIAIWVGFFPWSILGVPVVMELVRSLRRKDEEHAPHLLLACWVGVYVVLFSLAQTKLPSYVTPCYPALALLCGSFVYRWSNAIEPSVGWIRSGLVTLCGVGAVLVVGLVVAARAYLPGLQWLGLVGVIPILGSLGCLWALHHAHYQRVMRRLALTATLFSLALFSVGAVAVSKYQHCDRLFGRLGDQPNPLVAFGNLESSWVYYARRPITFFSHRQIDDFTEYLAKNPLSVVIATERNLDRLPSSLTNELVVFDSIPYFLKDQPLQAMRLTPKVANRQETLLK